MGGLYAECHIFSCSFIFFMIEFPPHQDKESDITDRFKVKKFLNQKCNLVQIPQLFNRINQRFRRKRLSLSLYFKGNLIIHLPLMLPAKLFSTQASASLPTKIPSLYLCCHQRPVSLDFISSGGPCQRCLENCFVTTR